MGQMVEAALPPSARSPAAGTGPGERGQRPDAAAPSAGSGPHAPLAGAPCDSLRVSHIKKLLVTRRPLHLGSAGDRTGARDLCSPKRWHRRGWTRLPAWGPPGKRGS